MDFSLSEEQKMLHDTVFKFAKNEWEPRTIEIDEADRFPWWLWERLRELGWCGLMIPEEYGGAGLGALEASIMFEAAGHAGADTGSALAWSSHAVIGTMPIVLCGNEEQKARYLPKLATGEWISCFCLTEPNVGSDAASVQCSAVLNGDHYILNGTKMFITNGPIADVAIVIAATDKSKGARGVSAFIVEKNFAGFSVGRKLDKIGQRGSETSEVIFDNCVVPVENRLLAEGQGFSGVGAANLEYERVVLPATWVGTLGYNLDLAVAYANQRTQFGQPIARFPQIRDMLVRMKMDYDVAKMLLYRAAWMKDQGTPAPLEATMFKIFVGQASMRSAIEGMQVHGGYGMMKEYKIERSLRDAKLTSVGGGTEQVLNEVIARLLTGTRSLTM
ncbi:MAG: acyl-CoA dehydrogenase family protein [Ignavibacteriales bacterium]